MITEERVMLSPHFSLKEMTNSGTAIRHGIENKPNEETINRLRALCQNVLEPLRTRFGAIRITSGYRCQRLNALVGGQPNSQHLYGEAADLHIASMEVGQKMFDYIRDHLPFDQLLFEHNMRNGCRWLHVSFKSDRGKNRKDAREVKV